MAPSQPTGSGTAIPASNIQGRQGVTYEYGVAVGEAVGQTRRGSGPSGRLPLSFGSYSSRRQGRCAGPGQASRTPHPEARTARLHTKYFVRHDQQLPVGRHALGKAGTSRGWRSLHKPTGPAELSGATTHQESPPSPRPTNPSAHPPRHGAAGDFGDEELEPLNRQTGQRKRLMLRVRGLDDSLLPFIHAKLQAAAARATALGRNSHDCIRPEAIEPRWEASPWSGIPSSALNPLFGPESLLLLLFRTFPWASFAAMQGSRCIQGRAPA